MDGFKSFLTGVSNHAESLQVAAPAIMEAHIAGMRGAKRMRILKLLLLLLKEYSIPSWPKDKFI